MAQVVRPDRSVKTFWQTPIDDAAVKDPGLEVLLPEAATLTELAQDLLAYQQLPGLWSTEEITLNDVSEYFAGGHTATVPREGYEDTVIIPKCEAPAVEAAIGEAVERGTLWLTNGPASILGEPIPAGVLTPTATFQRPPDPISVEELMVQGIPGAWKDRKTNALAISTALSAKLGKTLPWPVVRDAIDAAIRARWIELADDDVSWPCEFAGAQQVVLQVPAARELGEDGGEPYKPKPKGLLVAEARLLANGIQDLSDQVPDLVKAAVGHDLKFHLRVEFGGETPPEPDAVEQINALLAEVSEELKLA